MASGFVAGSRGLGATLGTGRLARLNRRVVGYWGFLFVAFVFLLVYLPATGGGKRSSEVLIWCGIYFAYQLGVAALATWAQVIHESTVFRIFRLVFNLTALTVLAWVAPLAAHYLWFFFSLPLFACLLYFGARLRALLPTYLGVCAAIALLTFRYGVPDHTALAVMIGQDVILLLLAATFFYYVQGFPRLQEEDELYKAAAALIDALDGAALPQLLADAAKAGIPAADAAAVHLIDHEDGATLVARGSTRLDITQLGRSRMAIGVGIAGHAINERRTIRVADVQQDSRYVSLDPSFANPRALMSAPMYVGQRIVGAISVHSARRSVFDANDERYLTLLAAQGAMAIAHADQYGNRLRRQQQIAGILQASYAFSLDQPFDALLQDIADTACRCSSYQVAVINLAEGEEIVVRAMAGVPPAGRSKLEGLRIPLRVIRPLLRPCYRQSQSYFIRHDRRPNPAELRPYSYTLDLGGTDDGEWHAEDILIVPLQTQGEELVGYISVDNPSDRQLPSVDGLQGLEVIARLAADAIRNARLLAQQRLRSAQLALINQVGQQVTAVLDLPALLAKVTEAVCQTFDYDSAAVFMVRGPDLVLRAIWGMHGSPGEEHTQPVGVGIIGWVAEKGESLLANDVLREPRFRRLLPEEDRIRSELAVPIRAGDVTIGVLDVQSVRTQAFDPLDEEAMVSLADQLAVAIQNAQLFATRRQQETRLREFLATVTSSLAQHTTLTGLYKLIVEAGTRFLSARDCSLFLADGDGQTLQMACTTGMANGAGSLQIPIGSQPRAGLVAYVAQTGRALRLFGADIAHHAAWNGDLWRMLGWTMDEPGRHSLLAAPMCTLDGTLIGVLVARDARGGDGFSDDDEQLLQTLATNAAAGIVRVRTVEGARADGIRAERARLENELHEAMGILATGVRWESEILYDELQAGHRDGALEALERLQAARTRAYTDLSYLLEDLRDPTLEQEGLLAALVKRAQLIGHERILVRGDLPRRLPAPIEGMLYRVGQEAMSNAVKHSGVEDNPGVRIELTLTCTGPQVELCVQDDGEGFDVEKTLALSAKWSLRRLRDMVREMGGRLDIDAAPGRGTQVRAVIDLPRA
jgi:GAF domain-containing protein